MILLECVPGQVAPKSWIGSVEQLQRGCLLSHDLHNLACIVDQLGFAIPLHNLGHYGQMQGLFAAGREVVFGAFQQLPTIVVYPLAIVSHPCSLIHSHLPYELGFPLDRRSEELFSHSRVLQQLLGVEERSEPAGSWISSQQHHQDTQHNALHRLDYKFLTSTTLPMFTVRQLIIKI